MSEPVTQGQFFEVLRQLDAKMSEQHQRVHLAVKEGVTALEGRFRDLESRIDRQMTEHRGLADRVLVIETQRSEEAKQVVRRGVWAAILATTGLTALLEAVKHYWSAGLPK